MKKRVRKSIRELLSFFITRLIVYYFRYHSLYYLEGMSGAEEETKFKPHSTSGSWRIKFKINGVLIHKF